MLGTCLVPTVGSLPSQGGPGQTMPLRPGSPVVPWFAHSGFLEDGILVQDVSRTRWRYLGSWTFPWDVMAVLPTELLCMLPGLPRVMGVPAARANRCLRVPRLFEAFDRCETRTARPNVFRMAKLMLYLLLGIHWHACLYFALSAHLGLGHDPWVCPSSARLLRRYLHSFYFSTLVLAMVGDTPAPQHEEEFLFLTAGFLLAVLGFATITGSISAVIVNLSTAASAFYPDAGPVRRYLRARGVGGRLQGRVERWQQHLRAQRKLPAEREVLQPLPRGLRAEVAASVYLAALQRVGLFRGWERGVLRQLVLRLRPQVFGPGEFVCRRGDVGREMYFIREGRLAVVAEDGVTQLAVLGEGLYFGEISLINIKGELHTVPRRCPAAALGSWPPRAHGPPPHRQHGREPAHGQHPEHRVLRPVLLGQGGPGRGAGRVPPCPRCHGGQGPGAAAAHGTARHRSRGGGVGGRGRGGAAAAGAGGGPGGAADTGSPAAGAAGGQRPAHGPACPEPREKAAPAAAAAGQSSGDRGDSRNSLTAMACQDTGFCRGTPPRSAAFNQGTECLQGVWAPQGTEPLRGAGCPQDTGSCPGTRFCRRLGSHWGAGPS